MRHLPGPGCASARSQVFPAADRLIRPRCDGRAEDGMAVQHGGADLKLGNMAVKVPRHGPLSRKLQTDGADSASSFRRDPGADGLPGLRGPMPEHFPGADARSGSGADTASPCGQAPDPPHSPTCWHKSRGRRDCHRHRGRRRWHAAMPWCDHRARRPARHADPPQQCPHGPKAPHALTFKPDHSSGANHQAWCACITPAVCAGGPGSSWKYWFCRRKGNSSLAREHHSSSWGRLRGQSCKVVVLFRIKFGCGDESSLQAQ